MKQIFCDTVGFRICGLFGSSKHCGPQKTALIQPVVQMFCFLSILVARKGLATWPISWAALICHFCFKVILSLLFLSQTYSSQSIFLWEMVFSRYCILLAAKARLTNTRISHLWYLIRIGKEKTFQSVRKHLIARLPSSLQSPWMSASKEAKPTTPPILNLYIQL